MGRGPPTVACMGMFQVTRIKAEPCPADQRSSRHITEVELHGADGFHQLATHVVRLMLSSGDHIVAVSTTTGSEADVRKGRCACGVKSIRSINGTRRDDDLSTVPTFS